MKPFLIIIFIILLLLAVVLFVPTYLIFEFEGNDRKKSTALKIKYLFFKILLAPKNKAAKKKKEKKKKPESKKKADARSIKERIDKQIEIYRAVEDDIADIILYAKRRAVTVREISFKMNIGLSEPMDTGIATGGLYGVIYNIIALLDYHLTVEKCDVKIEPDFDNLHIDTKARCILKVKNVHIMIIVFKVIKLYFKIINIK